MGVSFLAIKSVMLGIIFRNIALVLAALKLHTSHLSSAAHSAKALIQADLAAIPVQNIVLLNKIHGWGICRRKIPQLKTKEPSL